MKRPSLADSLLARGELLPAARALCEEGRHQEAAAVFARICMEAEAAACAELAGDPVSAHRYRLLAKDWAGAAAIRSRVVESGDPQSDAAILEMAGALTSAGRHGDAAPLFEAMGELDLAALAYRSGGEHRAAAELEMLLGRPREAASLLRAWIEARPSLEPQQMARAQLALSHALALAGDLPEAAIALQHLLSEMTEISQSEREEALGLLVAVLRGLGHPAGAEEVFSILRRHFGRQEPDYQSYLQNRPGFSLADTGDDGAGRLVGGRYRLAGLLGSGGTGQVFRATDEVSGREVAVKLVSAGGEGEALSRFFREARIAAAIDHPGLVRVLKAVPERGYLVMEYLPGGTLADRLRGGRRLSLAQVKEIGLALCRVLAAVHRRGILHRDVKPANILFDEAGRPRLGDLGAAHLFSFRQTESGYLLGTLAFMAPEQLACGKLSASTDVFALGVTLYRALTGRLPFPGPDIAEQQREGAPPPSSSIEGISKDAAAAMDRVMHMALEVRPEQRISSADELFAELSSWPVDDRAGRSRPSSEAEAEERLFEAPSVGTKRYEVLAQVGARVSLASDQVLHRPVALERFPANEAGAWLERVSAISSAGNPHLQALLDIDTARGFVVWQWLEGQPLSEFVGGAERPPREAKRIGADLARALVDHPGALDPGAVLVHRGRAMVALAGSEVLRDDRLPPDDPRPFVGRIVGWIQSGSDPGETAAPLEELARSRGEDLPSETAALAGWLAVLASA